MRHLDKIVDEYRKIDSVHLWTDPEKAAARAVLRGVVVRCGLYPEFLQALQGREEVKAEAPRQLAEAGGYGGFIRF